MVNRKDGVMRRIDTYQFIPIRRALLCSIQMIPRLELCHKTFLLSLLCSDDDNDSLYAAWLEINFKEPTHKLLTKSRKRCKQLSRLQRNRFFKKRRSYAYWRSRFMRDDECLANFNLEFGG